MTNLIDALHIPDTQSEHDERKLAIQRVGIRGVRYPLQLTIEGAVLPTVAEWSLDVALPAEQKGTHMSRFVAWLDALGEPVDAALLERETARMLALLHAEEGRVEAGFPFFLRKRAPVSGSRACSVPKLIADPRRHDDELGRGGGAGQIALPVLGEISDYGAHNQRSA
jgi:GTP cyclohydrolase I